jgi:hypothetical protein
MYWVKEHHMTSVFSFNKFILGAFAVLALVLSGCAHKRHHSCGCKKDQNQYQCSADKKESCGCEKKCDCKEKCDCGENCKCEKCASLPKAADAVKADAAAPAASKPAADKAAPKK